MDASRIRAGEAKAKQVLVDTYDLAKRFPHIQTKLGTTLHGGGVALRIDCASQYTHSKIYSRIGRLWLVFGLALFCVIAVWKYSGDEDSLLTSNKLTILNLVVGSIIATMYIIFAGVLCSRVYGTLFGQNQATWDPRRARVCIMAGIDLVAGLVAIGCFLAGNGVVLKNDGCGWFLAPVGILAAVRSSAFGVILANQMMLGLIAMPVQVVFKIIERLKLHWLINFDSVRNIVHGIDLPSWIYAMVFFAVYIPFQLLVVFLALTITGPLGGQYCTSIYDTRCYENADVNTSCHDWDYTCGLPTAAKALSITISVYAILVLLVYFFFVIYTMVYLRSLPYELYRVNHTELGFQLQTRFFSTLLFLLSVIGLWLVENDTCNSSIALFLGFLPLEMASAYLVCTTVAVRLPHSLLDSEYNMMLWNQTIVWEEEYMAEHNASKPIKEDPSTGFCFETALKAWYFAFMVYDIEEVEESPVDINTALSLYNLSEYKLIWKQPLDAKSVIAWNSNEKEIVVSFRGTASKQNALSDMKVWRTGHPPEHGNYWLGSMPMVHSGFHEFWNKSNLREEVIALMREIMSIHPEEAWKISCFGHSLGGAASKLAALDLQREFTTARVSCITFGCPYVGNSAFAEEFNDEVEQAWDIFHPNDAVSTSGKLFFLYQRCSQVCLISRFGDLIVNPSHLERRTLHRFFKKSVTEHLLSTYAASFSSIIEKYSHVDLSKNFPSKGHLDSLINKAEVSSIVKTVNQMRLPTNTSVEKDI